MDRRRWIVVAVLIALLAACLWWVRGRDGAKLAAKAGAGSSAGVAAKPIDRDRVDPRTQPAASLAGTVRDPAGAAIAGAWVCAWISSEELASEDTRTPRCATTDVAGAWRLADLWPGRWSVTAGAERRIPEQWRDPASREHELRLRAGEARGGVDLVLRDGGVELAGAVLDLTGGTVGGAIVNVSPSSGGDCHAISADDGTFHCWVAPGEVWAMALAPGYAYGWTQGVAPSARLEVLLTPESVLGGIVTQGGAPVAGARVQASGGDGGVAFTDDAGRFRIAGLTPGRYALTAEIEGAYGEAGESVLVGLAQTRDDLTIELHAATPVTGTIALADGAPVDGCGVSLARGDGRRYDVEAHDGAVHLRAVQPGSYRVSVSCKHHVSRAPYDDLEVAAAPVEAAWTVDAGLLVRGVVVDADGAPIADTTVSARNVGGDPRAARAIGVDRTGADGKFVIAGLRAGAVELEATADTHPRLDPVMKLDLAADADVTITLDTGGAITGTVVDDTGAAIAGANIRARGAQSGGGGTITGDDGAFTIRGLRAGAYRVTAAMDGELLRKPGTTDDDLQGEPATVAAGKTASVTLVVEGARGAIRGRVVDADGQPVTDAFVSAERESEAAGAQRGGALRGARWSWRRRPAVTDLEGAFALSGLAPGTYTVLAYRRGGSEASAQGVALGSSVTLTITPTGSLAGVVETGGEPPAEVQISLVDPATGVWREETFFRTAGAWSFHDLPAGSYDLTATAVGGTATLEDVALADGHQRAGVTITLRPTVTVTGRVVDDVTREPVPGMRVMMMPIDGAGGGFSFSGADGGDQISDASGRFSVEDVPQGRVRIVVRPKDAGASEYLRGGGIATVAPPAPADVGDLIVVKRRVPRNTRAGDLGFTLAELPPDTDPAEVVLTVATVRKDGPAAGSGLVAGDVIVGADGRDVRGEQSWLFRVLTQVPEGTVIQLALARGETISIRAGPPT